MKRTGDIGMFTGGRRDPLGAALREIYRADIDAERSRIGDPSVAWHRAQVSARLERSFRSDRAPLAVRYAAIVAAAAILGFWWGDATAAVNGMLLDSGGHLDGFWAARISEILVGLPVAFLRTLLG